jgi:glutamate racemase
MKIGVFDSGVGGAHVAATIINVMPEHEVILREDKEHVPYGTRQPAEILQLVLPIFEELSGLCDVIVIACNTVSMTIISDLRSRFSMPLIPVEPLVKLASELTGSGVIAVCATPATLASAHYKQLKTIYAEDLKVLQPDCADWASMIEHNKVEGARIAGLVAEVLHGGADVIVLGCTHYHWIEEYINRLASGQAKVLQPEPAILADLRQVLEQLA